MLNDSNRLGTEKIGKLLCSFAVPAIVAQVINLLYNVVDRYFIARLGNDGALSGLTVCFPILLIVSAFSALIGMSGAPLSAIQMGKGDKDKAEKIIGNCLSSLILISLVLTLILELTATPILDFFGATEESLPYAVSYAKIYLIGTIFVQISLGMNAFISSQGFAKISMITVLIGAILNIALDPIFIYVLDMGVKGAALATIISQFVSAVWVMVFLLGKKCVLKIRLKNLIPDMKIMGAVLALGISPFIMQATDCAVQLVFNISMKKYSAEPTIAVAGMGILFTIMQILSMPLSGLGQGAMPIISYNYGAQNMDRVKKTFKLLFITSIIGACVSYILIMSLADYLVKPFSTTIEVERFSAYGLRIFMAGTFALGCQFSCQQTLVALGQSKISLFLALLRKVILLVPLAIILPLIFQGDRIDALLAAEPIADVIAATTTTVTYFVCSRKLLKQKELPLDKE